MSTQESSANTAASGLLTYSVRVTGRVQGVGYRDFTRAAAQQLRVSGWVRNDPDGSVHAVAQSSQQRLVDCLIERMREGPPGSRVDTVQLVQTETGEIFESFERRK
ncbi:MAG: acylphosphatase [bacterium]|nr:acylphosphatase [bacterium]